MTAAADAAMVAEIGAIWAWLEAEQEAQRLVRMGRFLGQLAFYHRGEHQRVVVLIEAYRDTDAPWRGDLLEDTYWRQRHDMVDHHTMVRDGWGNADMRLHASDPRCLAAAHWV